MSVLADSLRRLRQQAGVTPVPSRPAGTVGARHAGEPPERNLRPAPHTADTATSTAPSKTHVLNAPHALHAPHAQHAPHASHEPHADAIAAHPPHAHARPFPRVADPSLRRLLDARALRTAHAPARPRPFAHTDRTLPGDELAPGLRYLERYPGVTATPDDTLDLPALAARNIGHSIARRQALYFDTETTGLAGGTGTRAFMIGAADWQTGRLRVRQLWLTRFAGETAMLEAFRDWLSPDTLLVSYNGRCYDGPLLATRYRLARLRNPLDGVPHLDLLHAVRRRYRGVWENCRLATVERQLLRILREDDLPGSEAPRAFLDYIRGGPATDLRRVLAHNHQDVVSLAQLLERLLAA
jgi:hypothetical protein